MTDFHAHILPGLDDGARDVTESLALLSLQKAQGIETVIATPHYYHDIPVTEFLEARSRALEALSAAKSDDMPRLLPAAEVLLYYGLSQEESLASLCIPGTNYLLVEMPFSPWNYWVYEELYNLQGAGVTPVLAHIERYVPKVARFSEVKKLLEMGYIVQFNAESLLKRSSRRWVRKIIQNGAKGILGSDCHSIDQRPPMIAQAKEMILKKWGKDVWAYFEENEKEIVK